MKIPVRTRTLATAVLTVAAAAGGLAAVSHAGAAGPSHRTAVRSVADTTAVPAGCATGAGAWTCVTTAGSAGGAGRQDAAAASWCETQSVCHRKVTDYVEETVGNGAYGVGGTLIGRFQITLRTNLNGRQPRYTLSLHVVQGPRISGNFHLHCRQHGGGILGIDADCYDSQVVGPVTLIKDWTSRVVNGNRLDNDGTYYGYVDGSFHAEGVNDENGLMRWWNIDTLTSGDYECTSQGTAQCRVLDPKK
jgi:hypothetical protein